MTTGTPLRAAVIGCGSMGRNHVRVLSELADVELAAIVDTDQAAATALARGRLLSLYNDVETLLEKERVDIAVVATPTSQHASVTLALLQRGIHCLVEKPIAPTLEEAGAIAKAAETAGVVLAVGHVERYNPAIIALKERLAGDDVYALIARRTGPFPDRIRDVDVITDLATHDIDIMLWLTGSRVARVAAETA